MDKKKLPISIYIIIGLAIFLLILIICMFFIINNNSTLKSKNDENINKIKVLNGQIADLSKKTEIDSNMIQSYGILDGVNDKDPIKLNIPIPSVPKFDIVIIVTYGNVKDTNYMLTVVKGEYVGGANTPSFTELFSISPDGKKLIVTGDGQNQGDIFVKSSGMGDSQITINWGVLKSSLKSS
jgi:hypothetical protein